MSLPPLLLLILKHQNLGVLLQMSLLNYQLHLLTVQRNSDRFLEISPNGDWQQLLLS